MIIYIKELEKEKLSFIEKIKVKLKMIIVKELDDNRKILLIPNIKYSKSFIRLNKKIAQYSNCKILLSKKIKKYEKQIETNRIIKGKIVQKHLIHKILKLVESNLKTSDIYILSKKYDSTTVKMVEYFVEKVKTVNIVTNEIIKYKKLEEQIYNEKGIIMTVSNNKKKSLKKARIIINLDLNNEEIRQYNINRDSIVINIADEKIDKIISFEGIIINNVQIELNAEIREKFVKDNLYEYFENAELYESVVGENIQKEHIRLKELVGNNGIIDFNEIQRVKNKSKFN